MTRHPPFQLASTPLSSGTTLIEASAGTGKTFTIAGLFLRLILEQDLSVREILVVTFTEAATEELRDRIRRSLADAAAAFRLGCSDNPVMKELIAPHRARASEMLFRLDRALCGFDEAPIFTIHGFCQRTLKDRAFESGVLFDTELLKDDSSLLQEVADDFWRKHFYEAPALRVSFALKNKYQPEKLLPLLRTYSRHPQLKVLSSLTGKSLNDVADELTAAFRKAANLWRAERENIRELFGSESKWAIGDHKKPEIVEKMLRHADACFTSDEPTPESLAAIQFLSRSALEEDTSKKAETPEHELFDLCEEICGLEANFITRLQLTFLDFVKLDLPQRKQRLKIQTFDDLLTRLHAALKSSGGDALAHEIRTRYKAALIDEFQDTDPVQYQNFHRIFGPTTGENPSLLFLIGDPKQAIYGFRGADIFTYLEAAQNVDHRFTLDHNWRSESALVTAVNSVFAFAENPFLFDEIQFQPVVAAGQADKEPLTENGTSLPPLHLWFMPRGEDGKPISKDRAQSELPPIVAAEIARLLNSDVRVGSRKLTPRDIAVLVPENRQARMMQDALRALGIPSVLHTEESVFESHEAQEFCRVLAAMARPLNERLLRAALATDLQGLGGAELEAMTRDDNAWQQRLQVFHDYHELWMQRGFTAMFREWLHREGIRQRLLAYEDGERRLTNLLHLAELLHQTAQERRLAAEPLVRWLEEQISGGERTSEEHQLRLERDDEAVRLVTIHKSKGLEYPVVFCPFSWRSAELNRKHSEPVYFHRQQETENGRTHSEHVCDFDSPEREEHAQLEFRERLAESLRLLYVALTRARNRCYFVWGAFNKAGTSAPAWLFHRPASSSGNLQAAMDTAFKTRTDAELRRDLQHLADSSAITEGKQTILLTDVPVLSAQTYRPPAQPNQTLVPRQFNGHIPRDWRITSFSSLTANLLDEAPDHDRTAPAETPAVVEDETKPTGIFAFPRGTTAGTCLHKLFELADFTNTEDATAQQLIRETLTEHGFSADKFAPAVHETLRRTCQVALDPRRPDFNLARIPHHERLNELEFFFPIHRVSPALVASGLGDFATSPDFAAQLQRLNFKPTGGFLKGFIDLVFRHEDRFYIVDWKSNWLGNRVEEYHHTAMAREMSAKYYQLQYLLYTVALHQYLALRLPGYDYEQHFGGALYLFIRGIDPSRPELGVYRDRPSQTLIEQLSHALRMPAENPTA